VATIARVEAWPVNVPLDAPYLLALGTYRGLSRTIIRLTTDEGVAGLGETPSAFDARLVTVTLDEGALGRCAERFAREGPNGIHDGLGAPRW
jgi:glucarate dehydratase